MDPIQLPPHQRRWLTLWVAFMLICAGCGDEQTAAPTPVATPPPTPTPTTPAVPATAIRLKILTYNVLADIVKPDPAAIDRRWPALFALLEKSDADVLCLQEVRPDFLARLKKQPWFAQIYQVPRAGEQDVLVNGNILCVKAKIEKSLTIDHHSPQDRQSQVVWFLWHGRRIAVATCHLDSYLEDGPVRARELDQIFAQLTDCDDAILAGDFNFGDGEEPDSSHLDKNFTDLWTTLHPQDKGFTWDIEKSAMAAKGSFTGETSRRIDRILVRSRLDYWKPATARIIGDLPLVAGDTSVFPSDHFGLVGELWSAPPSGAAAPAPAPAPAP